MREIIKDVNFVYSTAISTIAFRGILCMESLLVEN